MAHPTDTEITDLFIIGGGINGCGIARDAAGRGLSVTLAEMNDLASATSSATAAIRALALSLHALSPGDAVGQP